MTDYFKENFRVFKALDFIAEVTAHIPPKNKQYIRRYGLGIKNKGLAARYACCSPMHPWEFGKELPLSLSWLLLFGKTSTIRLLRM